MCVCCLKTCLERLFDMSLRMCCTWHLNKTLILMVRALRSPDHQDDLLIKPFSTTHWTQISYLRPPHGRFKPDRTVLFPGNTLIYPSVQTKHVSKPGNCTQTYIYTRACTVTHLTDTHCLFVCLAVDQTTSVLQQTIGKICILWEHWVESIHPQQCDNAGPEPRYTQKDTLDICK